MSAYNAIPYAAQFGGMAQQMTQQFSKLADLKKTGAAYNQAMGGTVSTGFGIAGAALGTASTLVGTGLNADRSSPQGKKDIAAGTLNAAGQIASAAGPWGMVAAAPLQLVSALLKIKGPRQKRHERREQLRQQTMVQMSEASQQSQVMSRAPRSAGLAVNPITTVPVGAPSHSFGDMNG